MLRTGSLQKRLMLVGELDKNIFETGRKRTNLANSYAVVQKLLAQLAEVEVVINERVDGLPENRRAANAGNLASQAQRARDFGSGDFHTQGSVWLHVGQRP